MTDLPPPPDPADQRCQVLQTRDDSPELDQCLNLGTQWYEWPGCGCDAHVRDGDCVDGFFTWECDGPHIFHDHSRDELITETAKRLIEANSGLMERLAEND